MADCDFNVFKSVYSEDILGKLKICEFDVKDLKSWMLWQPDGKGQQFEEFATKFMYTLTSDILNSDIIDEIFFLHLWKIRRY